MNLRIWKAFVWCADDCFPEKFSFRGSMSRSLKLHNCMKMIMITKLWAQSLRIFSVERCFCQNNICQWFLSKVNSESSLGMSRSNQVIGNLIWSHNLRLHQNLTSHPDRGLDMYLILIIISDKCSTRSRNIMNRSQHFIGVKCSRIPQQFEQEAPKNSSAKLARSSQTQISGLNNSFKKHF